MKSYGLSMDGPLVIERVDSLPIWNASLVGRIVYDRTTFTYWIAGDTDDDGISGWIQFGLTFNTILSNYINWDVNLNNPDAISAVDVPTLYNDTTSNVQFALNSISIDIKNLITGNLLDPKSIKPIHIDFDSRDVPFVNSLGKYDVSLDTVEKVLNYLRFSTADKVILSEPNDFGLGINSNADNLQDAVCDLDSYLGDLTADKIKALIPATSIWSSVQSILESINSNLTNISFVDLVGTPSNYGIDKQFIKTNGIDTVYFANVYATDIICQYPGTISNTVQNALAIIGADLDELKGGNLSLDAHDISYDDSPSIGLSNVDDVLDYLITETFTSTNLPHASQIKSSGIGTTVNVQSSLEFLQAEVEVLNSAVGVSSPCQANFTPVTLTSNLLVSIPDGSQEFILLTHTYGGVTPATVVMIARVILDSSSNDQDLILSIGTYDEITISKNLLHSGFPITLMAKVTLAPNTTINLIAKGTGISCQPIVIKNFRMSIQPTL